MRTAYFLLLILATVLPACSTRRLLHVNGGLADADPAADRPADVSTGTTLSQLERTMLHGSALHATVDDDGHGRWAVAWTAASAGPSRIMLSLYDAGTRNAVRTQFVADAEDGASGASDLRPALTWSSDGLLWVAWQRSIGGETDLYVRCFDRDGIPRSEQRRLRPGGMSGNAFAPSLLPGADDTVFAAWLEKGDIYLRRIAPGGQEDAALPLLDDGRESLQAAPLAAKGGGTPLLVWADNRADGKWKFYSRQWRDGDVEADLLVDSAQNKAMTTQCTAWRKSADTVVYTFKDYREGHSNIYRRIAQVSRAALTPAERVNDDDGDRWQRLPAIDGDAEGNSMICWEDYRNTEGNQQGDIFVQAYDAALRRIGKNLRISGDEGRIPRKWPQLAVAPDGRGLVLWLQGEGEHFAVRGQWLHIQSGPDGEAFSLSGGAAVTQEEEQGR